MGCDFISVTSCPFSRVSIHAPTWGATHLFYLQVVKNKFQSMHPHGVRLIASPCIFVVISVSIHAPTWGATLSFLIPFRMSTCFNPRTHMGCDEGLKQKIKELSVSIHAPTWGATVSIFYLYICSTVSIHAPTWGATRHKISASGNRGFQSTHPHGVRHNFPFTPVIGSGFQSTHPHGVRQHPLIVPANSFCFNPRTHMGCDWICSRNQ